MARGWPRAVLVIGAAFLLQMAVLLPLAGLQPGPGQPLASLLSPWYWLEAALSGAFGVWFASVLLALFQALEAPAPEAEAPEDPSSGDHSSGK